MNDIACEAFLALVCDRLDGAPLAVDPATIEAHLCACRECRDEAAKLMRDDALLKELRAAGSTALEKPHVGHQPLNDPLIQRIVEKLQTLPGYSANPDGGRHLSDQELEWLSAAGTTMPAGWPVTKN